MFFPWVFSPLRLCVCVSVCRGWGKFGGFGDLMSVNEGPGPWGVVLCPQQYQQVFLMHLVLHSQQTSEAQILEHWLQTSSAKGQAVNSFNSHRVSVTTTPVRRCSGKAATGICD